MARIADSLATLRTQVNKIAPSRSKASDGWIGDAAHANTKSDHNPNVNGVVQALDITHDPAAGMDSDLLARAIADSRDKRVKYLISKKRILSGNDGPNPWVWREYNGKNPHSLHCHISVEDSPYLYDDRSYWDLSAYAPQEVAPEPSAGGPLLRKGAEGRNVELLQALLGVEVDGIFGPITDKAVRDFQRDNGLVADGIVGPYTWEALLRE